MGDGNWTSLEIAKLVVSVATPLIVLWLGFLVKEHFTMLEKTRWVTNKLIERRLQFFDAFTPEVNSILCFFIYIGTWKSITPNDVLSKKRAVDALVAQNAPLLSRKFLEAYKRYISALFATYSGKGEDAKLVADFKSRQDLPWWKIEFEGFFEPKGRLRKDAIADLYWDMMEAVAKDVGSDFDKGVGRTLIQLHPDERSDLASETS